MKVALAPSAIADLKRLGQWLGERNPRAAEKAIRAIIASVDSLGHFPNRGYGGKDGSRQLRVPFGKRGYVIRYKVTDTEVRIVRIFHGLEDR